MSLGKKNMFSCIIVLMMEVDYLLLLFLLNNNNTRLIGLCYHAYGIQNRIDIIFRLAYLLGLSYTIDNTVVIESLFNYSGAFPAHHESDLFLHFLSQLLGSRESTGESYYIRMNLQ